MYPLKDGSSFLRCTFDGKAFCLILFWFFALHISAHSLRCAAHSLRCTFDGKAFCLILFWFKMTLEKEKKSSSPYFVDSISIWSDKKTENRKICQVCSLQKKIPKTRKLNRNCMRYLYSSQPLRYLTIKFPEIICLKTSTMNVMVLNIVVLKTCFFYFFCSLLLLSC